MFGQPPLCSNPFFSLDVRDLEVLDPDDTPRDLILSRVVVVEVPKAMADALDLLDE